MEIASVAPDVLTVAGTALVVAAAPASYILRTRRVPAGGQLAASDCLRYFLWFEGLAGAGLVLILVSLAIYGLWAGVIIGCAALAIVAAWTATQARRVSHQGTGRGQRPAAPPGPVRLTGPDGQVVECTVHRDPSSDADGCAAWIAIPASNGPLPGCPHEWTGQPFSLPGRTTIRIAATFTKAPGPPG